MAKALRKKSGAAASAVKSRQRAPTRRGNPADVYDVKMLVADFRPTWKLLERVERQTIVSPALRRVPHTV